MWYKSGKGEKIDGINARWYHKTHFMLLYKCCVCLFYAGPRKENVCNYANVKVLLIE